MNENGITFLKVILQLIPVIVGSIITGVGVLIGNLTIQKYKSKKEKNNLYREKLEELVLKAYDIERWLDRINYDDKKILFDEYPLTRVKMLSSLYFKELLSEVKNLETNVHNFQALITETNVSARLGQLPKKEFRAEFTDTRLKVSRSIEFIVSQASNLLKEKYI